MTDDSDVMTLQVAARRVLTPSITEFTLVRGAGRDPVPSGDTAAALPGYSPGAHITVETPCGAKRRYSLVGTGGQADPEAAPERYVIAVKNEPASRGGSRSMHEAAVEGSTLRVSPPDNAFPLRPAPQSLLIAGGIGVTPIFSMAERLMAEGAEARVIYCARSPEEAAYRAELAALCGARITFHYDGGDPARVYDFWDHFAEPQPMQVYCCGPQAMMDEIRDMSGHWPEGRVQFEAFKPVEITRPDDAPFEVTLARSGQTFTVPADRTILETLRAAGVAPPSSCESGTCGTCKTRLISGKVDHRDMVLMEEEKDSHVMICISRAARETGAETGSGALVLDL